MVAIAPFRALRYDLERVALSDAICPPYDIISAAARAQLCARSSYNFVRLELPEEDGAADRYTAARRLLESWRQQRVLMQDAQPSIYLTEHAFRWAGQRWSRLGWVSLLRFNESTADEVLRHEATFDAPKADRTKLLEAVRAQLSPIFCIVPDPDREVHACLTRLAQADRPTAMAAIDSSFGQETIRLWPITDPQAIAELQQRVAAAPVLIADGHHRFAVAFANRRLCDGVMTYFACAEDPAVQVHPIHRVVRLAALDPAAWQARLRELCDWEPAASVEEGWKRLSRANGAGSFLYDAPPQAAVVRVREEVLAQFAREAQVPQQLAQLDVMILHHLLLPRLAGSALPVEAVRYTPDVREAAQMAEEARPACAWMLRPLPLATVFELASQRLALPQKSTYFYPKAVAGLTVHAFD